MTRARASRRARGLGSALVAAAIALAVGGCAIGSTAAGGSAAAPVGDSAISAAGLVDDTTAWALDPSGLHLSRDGGRSWQLRSPVISGQVGGAGFARGTAGTGWLTVLSPSGDVVVHRTSTAGSTWVTSTLRPSHQAAAAQVELLDAAHGWVAVKFATSVNFSIGELYRSADGGASFSRLSLPAFGAVSFRTPLVGFLSGAGPAHDQLWRTTDGGSSWSRAAVDQGRLASTAQIAVSSPVMQSDRIGSLTLTVTEGDATSVEAERTTDGGAHWSAASGAAVIGSSGAGVAAAAGVLSASELIAIDPADARLLRSRDGGRSWRGEAPAGLPAGVRDVRFRDALHGLALTDTSFCAGFKQDCHRAQRLFLTADGGRTWHEARL